MDFLEYSDISSEIKGSLTPGKLKMTDQTIIFKNSKTGKVEQIQNNDIDAANFQNFVSSWGIRIFLKNGVLHRFVGFKESDKEKIAKFFTTHYKKDMLEKELCVKGWNWGTAKFSGSVLSFDIGEKSAFEIPLAHVSQCITGKNEITMEFHQNDEAPVSLMEMRFFVPSSELAGDVDRVEAFQKQVMNKASVISVTGDAIAIFREIQCLTPRGRYDIKIFQTFFQLHGKTFDYKIPMSTVLRLFLLPHKDNRQMFFVISLDPPIKQGQTRYHFLVLLFNQDEEMSIELPFTEEELKEKYEGKLEKEVSGPTYEVLGKVMKIIINRKLTGPGSFVGHDGSPALGCSFKATAGYLYPLERGFIYVHKPPIHIRFEEVASVNFARSGGSTKSFDFEIELKSGTVHTFNSIEKGEYTKLFDFISAKKINVKNRGKNDKTSYMDDFGDSDNETAPDAYLERVKAEAQERDDDDDENSDESTDEDFDPDKVKKPESGSNTSSSDISDEDISESEVAPKKKTEKKDKSEKKGSYKEKEKKKSSSSSTTTTTTSEVRKKRSKKEKDENRPKRPATAFMIWLNEMREKIKEDNPGIKVTELAKKGGEMWKELKDKSEWEKKAAKAKEEYEQAMKQYIASSGGAGSSMKKEPTAKKKESNKSKTKSTTNPSPVATIKSKEYISDDDDTSTSDDDHHDDDDGGGGKNKKKNVSNKKTNSETDSKKKRVNSNDSSEENEKKKNKKGSDDDDEEEIESTPASSEVSDSD